jgi:sterol desaturase/sphingolipid hydroxylase (fatty acid hydroxylase superfamily)
MHHKFFVKNYGLWTTIWDRLMGTMHPKYEELYEKTTNGEPNIAVVNSPSSISMASERSPDA